MGMTDPAEAPVRVLIADDAPDIRLLLKMYLSDTRLEVIGEATNGAEAVESVERGGYDVVLMDVQMPELDGLEATRRIRAARPATDGPHIVAMTANALEGDRETCLAAGMNDYVAKPIRPDALAAALLATPMRSTGQDVAPTGAGA